MDPYFPIILTQNLLLCLGVSCFVFRSTILSAREKMGFHLCVWTGALITLCELVSTLVVENPRLIWLQGLCNVINMGLTPLLPAIPVLVIGERKSAKITAMIPVGIIFLLLLRGQLFTIHNDGSYSRDPMFLLFICCYLFNMVFLTYRSFCFSARYQNHNIISLLFISLFMISSTTIQLRHPQIHFSWFCVTVTVLLYLVFYADTLQKIDNLTGLLNRNAFHDYSIRCRQKISGVMMIDLDDFKGINDTYGHLTGDQYLTCFAQCLRSVFQHYGYCYRLGGDEFCILLNKTQQRPSPETLAGALRKRCASVVNLPGALQFSYGYQILCDSMSIPDSIELADRQMYVSKAERKKMKTEA